MNTTGRPDGDTSPAEVPEPLLDEALERFYAAAPAQRGQVVDQLCAEMPEHAAALRNLLGRLQAAERTLARTFPDHDDVPHEIGGLRVVQKLGEGAFGEVWMCEQTDPVARRVAVKVLRPGAGNQHTLTRFLAERQLLATLSHPTITHVYDAGHLADGRPFFVMELVEGAPITIWCRDRRASVPERLRLFVQLCHGIAHAHDHGVVHRDLKPGNVLVTERAGRPQPKIIDFGIAKALDRDDATPGTDTPPLTDAGRVLGTPGYMSPEQAEGRVADVDARADVFGLGVVLYELLTGELPWRRGARSPDDTPDLPSERLLTRSRDGDGATTHELRRRATAVRGDLDWITRKATAYRREDRYPSVHALAADVEHHLHNRPVVAGPPTWRYRTAKLLRRHRTAASALGAAAAVAVVAIGFVWFATTRERAHFEAARSAVDLLLHRSNALEHPDAMPLDAVRQQMANEALAFYDRWLAERPDAPDLRFGRAEALLSLSQAHWQLGQGEAALHAATLAGDELAALRAGGRDDEAMVAAEGAAARHRARALHRLHRFAEAAKWHTAAVQTFAALGAKAMDRHGRTWSAVLRERSGTAEASGDLKTAVAASAESVAVLEQLVAQGIDVAAARNDLVSARLALAWTQLATDDLAAARATLDTAAAGIEALGPERWRPAAFLAFQQARIAAHGDDRDAERARWQEAVAACEQWLAQEPLQARAQQLLHQSLRDLARVCSQEADWPAADRAMDRALAVAEAALAGAQEPRLPRLVVRQCGYDFARALWDRFRRADLPRAQTMLARAQAAAIEAPHEVEEHPFGWQLTALQLLLADAAGTPDGTGWEALAATLPRGTCPPRAENPAIEAWLGVARARLQSGDTKRAALAVDEAEALAEAGGAAVSLDFRSRLLATAAECALAAGAAADAEAPLGDLLRLRRTWWGHSRAGALRLQAWRLATAAGDLAGATQQAELAAASLTRVVESLTPKAEAQPLDPWLVLPCGQARLDLATLEHARGDVAAARAHLDAGLAMLARVAEQAHRDQWRADQFAAAQELRQRLP